MINNYGAVYLSQNIHQTRDTEKIALEFSEFFLQKTMEPMFEGVMEDTHHLYKSMLISEIAKPVAKQVGIYKDIARTLEHSEQRKLDVRS